MKTVYVRNHELRRISDKKPPRDREMTSEERDRLRDLRARESITISFQRNRLSGEGKSW